MSTEFNWNDESVKEFVTDLLRNGFYDIPKHIVDFKASKQPKQDWEIISLKDTHYSTIITSENKLDIYRFEDYLVKYPEDRFIIYSVKRLSDNTIWSIKDKFIANAGHSLTIKWFEIFKNELRVWSIEHGYWLVNDIKKVPLFITNDGITYYEGEKKEIFCTHTRDGEPGAWHIDSHPEYYSQLSFPGHYEHFFSIKEKAEEWMLYNKPLLSLREVLPSIGVGYDKEIIRKAKDKLNKP